MPRPRTPRGTYGDINIAEVAPGKYRARARYRFLDGKTRQIERYGPTATKAENALKTALTTIEATQGGTIKPTMPLSELAQRFLVEKREADRAEQTLETYGFAVTAHITPRIGDLTIGEATPEPLQAFLRAVQRENGHGAAKNCRSVLSGMMSIAVRYGAIPRNPVRELARIETRGKKGAEAIPLAQLPDFLEAVRADEYLQQWDTVELIEFMLATGWRVSEACGFDWASFDAKAGTAAMEAIAVRVAGKGVIRQEYGKTATSNRVTPLPAQTVEMLERRRARTGGQGIVFATPLGRLRDPSNTQREIRDRREALGYPTLSSHSFRKTVATALDAAGLSARDIAEYLGHANPSMTQDRYMAKQTGGRRAADAMGERLSR